jgi:hypothetical protein
MKNSKFLTLGMNDFIKGILMAIGTAILTAIYPIIQSGVLPTWPELKVILLSGLAAGITYLLKNLLTNSNGNLAKLESKE